MSKRERFPHAKRARRLGVLFSSARTTWRTPYEIVRRVEGVSVSGRIALDPCAFRDRRFHFARVNHTRSGLTHDWTGLGAPGPGEVVYMNPPYGKELDDWVRKARVEAQKGISVIALLPARVDRECFQVDVAGYANRICFLTGRLTFEGAGFGAAFPSALVLWSRDIEVSKRFRNMFAPIGWVMDNIDPRVSERQVDRSTRKIQSIMAKGI